MDKASVMPWLEPLAEDTTGEDLEYDPAFMELTQAANGRPETQFGPAEPPAWPLARELAEGLFQRTRDLRVALLWTRAVLNLEGLPALAPGLVLIHGLLDNFWDTLHPRPDPDDGDTFARLSALGALDSLDSLLGDVRSAQLVMDRHMGGTRVRDVEIALERLAPRADEFGPTAGQITGMLADMPEMAQKVREATDEGLEALKALQRLMNDRFGIDSAVDVKTLRGMLTAVQSLLPSGEASAEGGEDGDNGESASDESGDDSATPAAASAAPGARRAGTSGVHSVESRQDAIRAIGLICAYLDRHEPTNPAQLLLRRAERLIDKGFLHLIKDLAPDAVGEIARILGVDPETLNEGSDSY
ncbi:type VI secretion system protein TssA [Xylophilus rhododendri]|uniref:Type VI secretion system protein TssA n=1 Tax=Xylophilus rhododendri TaxID=2697032 RepID=A0A857JAE8_9BURK|nr:type VI secretion system protein TssA [Xylophilus rhododendri]QHJ00991.1 type VI secretion system protein TssA [Xylophilus rhododendri]